MYAYVGSRTTRERNARGEGISVYKLDAAQRRLELVQLVEGLVNPSFLALNKVGNVLYTVHGDQQEISALKVDAATGKLELLQRQDCGGRNPVHLALDPTGRHVIVSNHISGTLAVLPLRADGGIDPVSQLVHMPGSPGPHRVEQPFAKPHFNPFDPSGKFVVVPDKGLNRVFGYRFEGGKLEPTASAFAETKETAGPRHVAFHPKAPYAYVVNELDSTVTAYRFDSSTGALTPFQVLSSLPDSYTGDSRASEIEIASDGATLYASNRGFDSIAVFRIYQQSGRIAPLQFVPSRGKTPRFFALTPNGKTLMALNEDSDQIVGFDVATDGSLSPNELTVSCGSPVCVVFSAPARSK